MGANYYITFHRGCTSLAILDLKEEEAQAAAKEVVEWFGELSHERSYLRTSDQGITEKHGEVEPGTIEAIGYGCDVSKEDSVQAVFQEIVDRWGKIDTVVASAGMSADLILGRAVTILFVYRYRGKLFCIQIPLITHGKAV